MRLAHRNIVDGKLRIGAPHYGRAFRMAWIVLVNNQTTARITDIGRGYFIVRARHAYPIYRDHLVVIGLGDVVCRQVIVSRLSSPDRCQKSLSAARGSPHYLVARDRRVAGIGFGPPEVDHRTDSTLCDRRHARYRCGSGWVKSSEKPSAA